MAYYKCTALFQQATNVSDPRAIARRLAGWSEGFYDSPSSFAKMVTDWRKWCQLRAAMLPIGAAIVGQRYQLIDTRNPSQTDSMRFPGTGGAAADVPDMALLCRVRSNQPNIRPMYLRGIPDGVVVEGEYHPSPNFTNALNAFSAHLKDYSFRGRLMTAQPNAIHSINADPAATGQGLVVFDNDTSYSVGDTVTIMYSDHNGTYKIKRVDGPQQVSIDGWTFGLMTGGQMRKKGITYPLIAENAVTPSRIVRRKVGRPFEQYVGRKSKAK